MKRQSLFTFLGIWHLLISDSWRRAFSARVPLAMMIVLRVLLIVFYYRSLGGFLIGSLDAFVQVSIHNPEGRPQFYGKTFGKTFGKGILHPFEQRKRKAEPLVFQRDSAICEIFSKKSVLSRKISRKTRLSLIYRWCQCISCWSNWSYSERASSSSS